MKRRLKQAVIVVLLTVGLVSASHRLWFQFRPIPVMVGFTRPPTSAERARLAALSGGLLPVEQFRMHDSRPYPDPTGKVKISTLDLLTIRAKASWTSVMPWRSTQIEIYSSTNVVVEVYERSSTRLEFTRDDGGWHMEANRPSCILWTSESAKPVFSFH